MRRRGVVSLACVLTVSALTGCAAGHAVRPVASALPSPIPAPPSGQSGPLSLTSPPLASTPPASPPAGTIAPASPASAAAAHRNGSAVAGGATAATGGATVGAPPAAATTSGPGASSPVASAPAPAHTSSGPTATAAGPASPTTAYQPAFPIDAAFYYPWFPEAWKQQGYDPFTNYHPSRGFYDSSDPATISAHISAMRYAGMDAGIASWWGQGSRTDGRISALLQAAASGTFRWSLYYELEGTTDPTVTQIRSDLTYIKAHYTGSPAYLRVGGKPVIFVYAGPNDACGMATRWVQANTVGFYVVLKVFPGYSACASQPNSWHQYAPANAYDTQAQLSVSISPGFWKKGDTVRLARDLSRWRSDVAAFASSTARFRLVTTFNEWGEGTAVESAQEWASTSGEGSYLDALHAALGSRA